MESDNFTNLSHGEKIALKQDRVVIGRHPECEITLETGAASRHHAQIIHEGDAYFLEDVGSRNGTFLNGERIGGNRVQLNSGDRVNICDAVFRFDFVADEASSYDDDVP